MVAEITQGDGTTSRADFLVQVQPASKSPALGAVSYTHLTLPTSDLV